jgi:hypothetical protein
MRFTNCAALVVSSEPHLHLIWLLHGCNLDHLQSVARHQGTKSKLITFICHRTLRFKKKNIPCQRIHPCILENTAWNIKVLKYITPN